MIKDLDATIKKLLEAKLPSVLNPESMNISFERPDEAFKRYPAINLFLYSLEENLEYRTSMMKVKSVQTDTTDSKTVLEHHPPVRVDCSYLVTAWSKAGSPEDEHFILSETMKVLLRHRKIPRDLLAGELDSDERPLPATLCLHPCKLNPGEFWQAMGGKPKPALNYTVTVDVTVFEPKSVHTVGTVKTQAAVKCD